ncbi:anoctamin-10 isoform X3 [Erpetoichthys calabaricus]|uniref:anoctamin-10 isoform X3 n=1 Tax=Erpetoichthys calabaricus TaxID=27687 RepID=UPI00109FC321|nr:anoctamin-10 isoform X3 [Erpetoichthys calabaricus]
MDRSRSARLAKSSWNRGTCQCCLSNRIQPLVVIQLDKKILPETKKWLISKIQEAELLVHPGEDDEGDMILLSISHCTLLHSAETLGLSKIYHNGEVMPFSITDRENFSNAANDEEFVTLAEKQYIIKQRLDHLKTVEEESIPGWPMNKKILKGELIFRKLVKQGLVKKVYPLHDVVKLKAFATQWYTEISLSIPTENHRVESSFQNFYTLKIIVFTFFNSFAVLFHIAFFKQDLQLLQKRLASLLIVSQVINQCTETLIPYMKERLFPLPGKNQSKDDPDIDKMHYQGQMTTCAGLFGEYIELFLQFGYLSFFSCVYPLTGALLLLNNLTEIRTDALKFCRIFQKPFAVPEANIGIWQTAFEMLGLVSVISNCFLILMLPQMTTYCQNNEIDNKTVLFLAFVLEQALIFLKIIIAFGIPDEPEWVRIKVAQIEFQSFQALKLQKQGL